MRALLAVLLFLTLAFSGCASKGGGHAGNEPSATTSATPTASPSVSASSTAPAPPPANRAPLAKLAVNATSGTAPLLVNLTVGGSDPDGQALTYRLVFGDGSADATGSVPASVEHAFTQAGNHTVELIVSDGKLSGNATATIAVIAGDTGVVPPPVTFTGTATGMCQLFDPDFNDVCVPEDAPIDHLFTMTPAVRKIVVSLTWDMPVPTASDLDLYVYDASGAEAGSSTCGNVDPAPNPDVPVLGHPFSCVRGNSEEAVIEGIALAQDATWTAHIDPYQAPSVKYTLTVTYS